MIRAASHISDSFRHMRTAGKILLIIPESYTNTPLIKDIERLCDPNTEVTDKALINLVVKYFYAYVVEGAHEAKVPLIDITEMFDLFSRYASLNEEHDDIDIMNRLRRLCLGTTLLADVPKASMLMGEVIGQRIDPETANQRFYGLDIGAASGILTLAQYIMARRNNFQTISILGLEEDSIVCEHSAEFCKKLRLGIIKNANTGSMAVYKQLEQGAPTLVTNQKFQALHPHLSQDEFKKSNWALFSALGEQLDNTSFFPEAVFAYEREQNVSVLLTKNNAFLGPKEYWDIELIPQGIISGNRTLPLHSLGRDMHEHFTPQGLNMMGKKYLYL